MKLMQHMFDRDMFMNEDTKVYNKEIMKALWKNKASYRRTIKQAKQNEEIHKLLKVGMKSTGND